MLNEIYDLFIDLDAEEAQLDFPVIYAVGRSGIAKRRVDGPEEDLRALFETVVDFMPGPAHDPKSRFKCWSPI